MNEIGNGDRMRVKGIYTARDSECRFAERTLEVFDEASATEKKAGDESCEVIRIKPQEQYQEVLGFGGAFTDTAAAALSAMKPELQEEAVRAYFDPVCGIGYNMGRIPIGGCDFSRAPYSHAEVPGDTELLCHSIDMDKRGIIPLIRRAGTYIAEELLLYALPWSPPGWMKDSRDMNWGGHLLPQYYPVMADYIAKFVQKYEDEGIAIWGVAAQNEPIEIQRWPSCEYTGAEERIFLKDHLIPALEKSGFGDKKILFWDCNKDFLASRAEEVLGDGALRGKVFGAAFHWYSGDYFEELDRVHSRFPEMRLLATESCVVMPESLDDWTSGERYAHSMIGDLNHWTCAWMDWNLFLNQDSGPGIADNPCAAPVILDEQRQKLIRMSSYYYIGHFSRYIRRGAIRLGIVPGQNLECCAFLNPDRTIAVVVMNTQDAAVCADICIDAHRIPVRLQPHSIETILVSE